MQISTYFQWCCCWW